MSWLSSAFIWFILYSFFGWIWEVIICSVPQKRFVNRGFLNGPYCPIYGAGALLVVIVLGNIDNPALLFLAGGVLTCTLEYITSWAMEKLFHARWWDYSQRAFNIKGRVCLVGFIAFGVLSVITIKLIHPAIETITGMIPEPLVSIIALVLFAVFLIDTVYTITKISELNAKLNELSEKINIAFAEKMHGSELYSKISAQHTEILKRFNSQEKRMMKAFPKIRSTKYTEAFEKIKSHLNKSKKNRKNK